MKLNLKSVLFIIRILTPAYNIAYEQQLFVFGERDDYERVQVEPFTEHPGIITHREKMGQYVKNLTPHLKQIFCDNVFDVIWSPRIHHFMSGSVIIIKKRVLD